MIKVGEMDFLNLVGGAKRIIWVLHKDVSD
jgi:hypothetical protein